MCRTLLVGEGLGKYVYIPLNFTSTEGKTTDMPSGGLSKNVVIPAAIVNLNCQRTFLIKRNLLTAVRTRTLMSTRMSFSLMS